MEVQRVLHEAAAKRIGAVAKKVANLGVYISTLQNSNIALSTTAVKPLVVETVTGMCVLHHIHKGLYNEANIEYGFTEAGTLMHPHVHDSWEELIVTRGEMHLYFIGYNKRIVLSAGGDRLSYYVKPNVPHFSFYPKDTWFYTVTIPADAGFER